MRNFLAVFGSLIVAGSFLPYLKLTIQHKVKPRVATWMTWSLVTGIGSVASFSAHAYSAGMVAAASTAVEIYILYFALKNGNRTYERVDGACQALAFIGIVGWFFTKDPVWAIVFTISADFFGGAPTLYHSYAAPFEEAWPSYITYGVGSLIVLFSIKTWSFANIAFPAYLAFMGITQGLNIIYWQTRIKTGVK